MDIICQVPCHVEHNTVCEEEGCELMVVHGLQGFEQDYHKKINIPYLGVMISLINYEGRHSYRR